MRECLIHISAVAVATSGMGAPAASEEEQDLSGFDGSSAASLAAASLAGLSVDGGTIRAVYQPGAVAGGAAGGAGSTATSPLRKRLSAAVLRLPRRGSSVREQQQQQAGAVDPIGWQAAAGSTAASPGGFEFARSRPASGSGSGAVAGPPPLLRSLTAPALGASSSSSTGSAGTNRRPAGASLLSIPEPLSGAHAAALEAPTPVMFGAGAARPGVAWASQQPHAQQQQQQQDQQHPAAVGLPPEAWSPIDLQEVCGCTYCVGYQSAAPAPLQPAVWFWCKSTACIGWHLASGAWCTQQRLLRHLCCTLLSRRYSSCMTARRSRRRGPVCWAQSSACLAAVRVLGACLPAQRIGLGRCSC